MVIGAASCTTPQGKKVVLQCDGGTRLLLTYAADGTNVTIEDGVSFTLASVRSGSGARYAGPEGEIWEHQGMFRWTRSGARSKSCTLPDQKEKGGIVGIANPASVHCVEVGGRNVTETLPSGSEFGLCLFEDNRQCGQWALFRGECPVGGLRIAGYPSDAARFCAITGATYNVQGTHETCMTRSERLCDLTAYFDGACR